MVSSSPFGTSSGMYGPKSLEMGQTVKLIQKNINFNALEQILVQNVCSTERYGHYLLIFELNL